MSESPMVDPDGSWHLRSLNGLAFAVTIVFTLFSNIFSQLRFLCRLRSTRVITNFTRSFSFSQFQFTTVSCDKNVIRQLFCDKNSNTFPIYFSARAQSLLNRD